MGGKSSSSSAQTSANTDRRVANDSGLVFAGDVGSYLNWSSQIDGSNRSTQLTSNTTTNTSDSRDQSLWASDSSQRNTTTNTSDSRDQSLWASDSSQRNTTTNTSDSRDQSLWANDSSQRNTTTNTTDARDQSLYANDNSQRTDNSTTSTIINTLDGGAVGRALASFDAGSKLNSDSFGKVLSTASVMFDTNAGLFKDTLSSVDRVLDSANKLAATNTAQNDAFRSQISQAYSSAVADKSGMLDNRTVAIIAVAGAAMLMMRR